MTVAETLQGLSAHMQTEGEYSLAVQRSVNSPQVRLYDSERPLAVVKDSQCPEVVEGWPRLLLLPDKPRYSYTDWERYRLSLH